MSAVPSLAGPPAVSVSAVPPAVSTVVAESESVLVWATAIAGANILTCHLRHVTHALALRVLGGDLGSVSLAETGTIVSAPVDVALPGPGTIAGFSGRRVDRQVGH